MTARQWDRALAAKVGLGLLLAYVAPVVLIVSDRARVWRNSRRWSR